MGGGSDRDLRCKLEIGSAGTLAEPRLLERLCNATSFEHQLIADVNLRSDGL